MSLLAQVQERIGPPRVSGPKCSGCVMEFKGERFIPHDGSGENGVLLLADSPWIREIEKGYLLAGPSGNLLEDAFRALRVQRRSFLLANGSMWCKPPHLGFSDHPEQFPEAQSALAHCRPYLDELIAKFKPRACVTLGGAALNRMCGISDAGSNLCYVLKSNYGIPVIPSYHPSYLFRPGKKKFFMLMMLAVRKALDIASGKEQPWAKDDLLLDPPFEQARAYLEKGLTSGRYPTLWVDIETPYAVCSCQQRHSKDDAIDCEDRRFDVEGFMGESYRIHRVGLSHTKGTALTMPWQPPYITLIKEALLNADVLVEHAHNHYDQRRLTANGCTFTGVWASSMWAWRRYQSDLDKALDFCAPMFANCETWKHLSTTQPALYNALDVVRTVDVWEGCRAALTAEGRWQEFWEDCVEFDQEILQPTQRYGVMQDTPAKDKLMAELKAEADAEASRFLQLVPPEARKVTIKLKKPKNSEGFVEVEAPVEVKKRVPADPSCPICGGVGKTPIDDGLGPVKAKLCQCRFVIVTETKRVWRKEEFNPGSSKQTKELLEALGLKVPRKRDKDGEWKDTTGKKQLMRLAKKNSDLRSIVMVRERRKLTSSYDWTPDADGRLRTFYGFNTSTWRLNSFFYALQTIPKRGPIAPRVRKTIVASSGCVLGEVDSAAIEAVLVGYYGQSGRYLSLAKAGVHGWLTAARMGQPIPLDLPFDELQRRCKAAKKADPKLYDSMKVTVHGGNYDQEPWGVFEQNPDIFNSPDESEELQKFYFESEPGQDVRKWQNDTRKLAAQQRYLQTPFGVRHWFFSVYRWDEHLNDWVPDSTGDAKRCLAFMPQSSGGSIQRWYARQCVKRYPSMKPFFRLFTHDDIKIEYPESLGEDPIRTLAEVMKEPIPQLDGLQIGVEAKIGYNLTDMREIA